MAIEQEESAIGSPITFIYTNIGRGHPQYLDGLVRELRSRVGLTLEAELSDVFSASRGASRQAWRGARFLYEKGSAGGILGWVYAQLRTNGNYEGGPGLRLLGRDIQREYCKRPGALVVGHPILVGVLRGHAGLVYQHGENVAPKESLVPGAKAVMAPTEAVADRFRTAGYSEGQIVVTGLCIERGLVAAAAEGYQNRIERLLESRPLVGAFFSSGAEPKAHVELLLTAASSLVKARGTALVFAHKDGRIQKRLRQRDGFAGLKPACYSGPDDLRPLDHGCAILEFADREQLNRWTEFLFPLFDFFVAPSHERTNWALGLGLPMFALVPCIGSYASLNLALMTASGVAEPILDTDAALGFGERLTEANSSGRLAEMAQSGWGKYDINGFERAAEYLIRKFG